MTPLTQGEIDFIIFAAGIPCIIAVIILLRSYGWGMR